jgi:hypothetical protein
MSARPVYDRGVDRTSNAVVASATDTDAGTVAPSPVTAPAPAPTAPAPERTAPQPTRPAADRFMRRLLRIPGERAAVPESETHRIFGVSIFLSATRCLLSYIVLPILLPLLGLAKGVGPWLGIPIGVLALTFDVLGIRRFWLADHHQRWLFSAVYAVVGTMVLTLLVIDVVSLVR